MGNFNIPPQSIDAEKMVLGSMMIDDNCVDEIIGFLSSDDFYEPSHQKIFDAIVYLNNQNKKIDILTVDDFLSKSVKGESFLAYLGNLSRNTLLMGNFMAHAKIIKEKSGLRKISVLGRDLLKMSMGEDNKSLDEIIEYSEKSIESILHTNTSLEAKSIKDFIGVASEELEKRFKSRGKIIGIETGFELLDKTMQGLEAGELVIVAARPGMGKTAFALNMAQHISINGGKALFISMEMPITQLINRAWSSFGIDHSNIRSGKIGEDEWTKITSATAKLSQSGLFVEQSPSLSVSKINAIAKKVMKKHGKMPIFIDYLQIMGSDQKYNNRYEEVTKFSMGIKAIAKNLNIPIVVLSQLNRDVESRADKRPKAADLRESGALEQDASTIIFLYRDEQYNEKSSLQGFAEAIIAKNRHGETKTIPLGWEGRYQRFNNLDSASVSRFYQNQNKPRFSEKGGLS